MMEPLTPVMVELRPILIALRNPSDIQNVKIIIDSKGHFKVLPEVPGFEVDKAQCCENNKTYQELCKTENPNRMQQQQVNNTETYENNLWIKKEPMDTYDYPPGVAASTHQWVKDRLLGFHNAEESKNSTDVNHWIKTEPVDDEKEKTEDDIKPDLNSINNSLSDDEMYNQQNDEAESTCVGERIYLPYNRTKIEESGGETNLLPDVAEPTVSDNEEKPKKKKTVVNGGVDVSRNHRNVHPCIPKKNIWATENDVIEAPNFTKSKCKWQEEKMARNKRRPPSRKSNHISTVLNSDKNNLQGSIQKKKQRLEKIPQQEDRFNSSELTCELKKTCHSKRINDMLFPHQSSDLLITCQHEEIRIWNLQKAKEVVRHRVANMTCNALELTRDGATILSAWGDGKIRAFGIDKTQTHLYEKFVINDAHHKGVTAITCTKNGNRIISGGGEGQVRIWEIKKNTDAHGKLFYSSELVVNMKEHKGTVSTIKMHPNDRECASASTDGTCIIWDLERQVRNQVMFSNTLFYCLSYGGPNMCHIITSGTDRKISYWETLDGSLIRELDGAITGAVLAMDISPDGNFFVTGGEEKLVKVWKYNEGEVTHVGGGHSSSIVKIRICPRQQQIVSAGSDGAILIWQFPDMSGTGELTRVEQEP